MAHGQRAAIQSNKAKDYTSRRYPWPVKSSYSKLLTHRRERQENKRIARKST